MVEKQHIKHNIQALSGVGHCAVCDKTVSHGNVVIIFRFEAVVAWLICVQFQAFWVHTLGISGFIQPHWL